MTSMDLFKAFSYIDDDLVFDAIQGGAQPQPSAGVAPVKQPKNNGPRRGGAKTKAIVIGAVAAVLAAAIVCMILYFTGVLTKQAPIYTGMEISSVNTSADDNSRAAVSYKYGGDYTGRNGDVDKDNPYGDDGSALSQQLQSTLTVTGSGEDIYYADAGEEIYITINFDNPDYYKIESFVLYDGTTETHYADYMFEDGSDFEKIIIKLNVGNEGGIIEYAISEILYIDGSELKNVKMVGDTVVRCGVRTSGMTTATVADETTTLTSISATINVTDKYSLIDYSKGYVKAVLFDGSTLVHIKDLEIGSNSVKFDNLTPDTLYQYVVVAYYDDLTGGGAALHYLYTSALYTPAIVLFDEDGITIDQTSITFDYSWYTGYSGSITSLTLTHSGKTQSLDTSITSITDLLSNNDYTLTATYAGTNGDNGTITLEFTTEAKATPEVEITVTDETVSTLTFSVDYTDPDGVGSITAIGLYNGDELVQSETNNLNQVEYAYSGLEAYTEYTLKVSYSYNLNDGVGLQTAEQTLSKFTDPVVEITQITVRNTDSTVVEGDTIVVQAELSNVYGVTFNSVVVNGETYTVSGISTTSKLLVEITNNGQLGGGEITLTITQINCTIGGETYSIQVSQNNEVNVTIITEVKVKGFSIARLNDNGIFEETEYLLASEDLYYKITLDNSSDYTITGVTISSSNSTYTYDEVIMSDDMQTAYVKSTVTDSAAWHLPTLKGISYNGKTKDCSEYVRYLRCANDEIKYITCAEDLLNMNGYEYYKLANDIDMSNYEWLNMNNRMYGVFDGGGYSIKNITVIGSYDKSLYLGLFYQAEGFIMNLNVVNMLYVVTSSGSVEFGALSTQIGIQNSPSLYVYDCTIDASLQVTCSGYCYVGGLTGYSGNYKISGVDIDIVADIKTNGSVNYDGYVVNSNTGITTGSALITDSTSEFTLTLNGTTNKYVTKYDSDGNTVE